MTVPTRIKLLGALALLLALASCSASSVTGPTTTTNTITNLYTSNLGPQFRCQFLTGTNMVKVGVARYLGSNVFASAAEFERLSPGDLNPTAYAVLPSQTNYVFGYAYWDGAASIWSNWFVNYNVAWLLSNNTKYTLFFSGDWAAITNGTGTLNLVQD